MNWIALPRWFILAALSIAATAAEAAECPDVARAGGERYLVVISDLHFGVGHTKDGKWDATEDFRWSGALQGFLQRISSCGKQAVDLVIAGDALELWQPPPDLRCTGTDKDAQCSTKQLVALTQHVVKAHAADLAMLGAFADTGSNKVFFIPGNHDAALLLPDAWAALSRAAGSQTGRVVRSNDGIWISPDGRVAVEHGHQIGQDVNSYAKWPTITREVGGVAHVESPWGERFVQQLFNEQEAAYPIIDNLSPETAGARYRMADRGIWRTSADMARFIRFNLFETSLAQKVDSLGPSDGKAEPPAWDLPYARKMGHQLFLNALA